MPGSRLQRHFALGTAISAAFLAGYGRAVAGGCSPNSGSSITCISPVSGTDITQNLTITGNGVVSTGSGFGISTSVGNALSITGAGTFIDTYASSIRGAASGIVFVNNAAAAGLSITTTGQVTGTSGSGISATNSNANSTTLSIVANNVSGAVNGIFADHRGTGLLSITTSGLVEATSTYSFGIRATNTRGSGVTISAVDVKGGQDGIRVINSGPGILSVTTTGTVTGVVGDGILARNNALGTDLTVTASGPIIANQVGVYAKNYGTGSLSVTTSGPVKTLSSISLGIYARNNGAGQNLNITASDITSVSRAIYSRNFGTGPTSISTSGIVQGGVAAIHATSGPSAQAITITNSGTIRNLSDLSSDLAIRTSGGQTTISNAGLVKGTVNLANLGSAFENSGTWNTAGGSNIFGTLAAANLLSNTGTVVAAANAGVSETTTFDTVGTFRNTGLLTLSDGSTGDRTVIGGDFEGNGGRVSLDTVLGDDSSDTDRLVITGNAGGSTLLDITNVGGSGALTTGNGIMLIEVQGNSSADAFRLRSAVAAGAYDYALYRSGQTANPADQNWYLRSTGQFSPQAQTVLPYIDTIARSDLASLGTFQQRVGNRLDEVASWTGPWARVGGLQASYDPSSGSAYVLTSAFLQTGVEHEIYAGDAGAATLGAFATLGNSSASVAVTADPATGAARQRGQISTMGYGIGGNATWIGSGGFYLDTVGQVTWHNSMLSAASNGDNQAWSSIASMEIGQRIALGQGWALVPQAQLVGVNVGFNHFSGLTGSDIALVNGDSFLGRLGLRLENLSEGRSGDDAPYELQFYGVANLSYQLGAAPRISVDGSVLEQADHRLWGEVGAGFALALDQNLKAHGELDFAHALSSGQNQSLRATAGLTFKW